MLPDFKHFEMHLKKKECAKSGLTISRKQDSFPCQKNWFLRIVSNDMKWTYKFVNGLNKIFGQLNWTQENNKLWKLNEDNIECPEVWFTPC